MHRWAEVEGDEQHGYTTTREDCRLPAWGGTPAMAMTRAQQMDRCRIEWATQPAGTRCSLVEALLRHLDPPDMHALEDSELDLAPSAGCERDAGMGRGL